MDLFLVQGRQPLAGGVTIGGSKNATLPIMAAALMVEGTVRLRDVPDLVDVATLAQVLRSLGMQVDTDATEHRTLSLQVADEQPCVAGYDLVRRMRASVCVLGPLLAKRGKAVVSLPGGCNIGHRPIDVHLRGLAALGADLNIDRGYVIASAERLKGAEIDLAGPRGSTVTGTANVLTAAVLSAGRTVLTGAAVEPEIVALARFLNAAGAEIRGVGTSTLEIRGVETLQAVEHTVIRDRIEAATLMIAAALAAGDGEVRLDRVPVEDLSAVFAALSEANVSFEIERSPDATTGEATVRLRRGTAIRPTSVVARPYPGFPTDLQAQWTALMTKADGESRITDTVFPDRFLHLPELARLGADVRRDGGTAFVRGVTPLSGANVMASDLRASAALVLAALASEGETVIRRIYHLDRGYARLDEKLGRLGAKIERRTDEATVQVPPPVEGE